MEGVATMEGSLGVRLSMDVLFWSWAEWFLATTTSKEELYCYNPRGSGMKMVGLTWLRWRKEGREYLETPLDKVPFGYLPIHTIYIQRTRCAKGNGRRERQMGILSAPRTCIIGNNQPLDLIDRTPYRCTCIASSRSYSHAHMWFHQVMSPHRFPA